MKINETLDYRIVLQVTNNLEESKKEKGYYGYGKIGEITYSIIIDPNSKNKEEAEEILKRTLGSLETTLLSNYPKNTKLEVRKETSADNEIGFSDN